MQEFIQLGFAVALDPQNLLFCLLGVTLGMVVGVLPGIGTLAAISMLLPLTFYMSPVTALIMLAGIYYGSEYGGSTASILLNLPGSASSAVTCIDGHRMARQGRAGVALVMTAISSFVGGTIGIALMMVAAPSLVQLGLSFGPAEYFALMLLGLLAAASLGNGSPLKGVAMVVAGVLVGLIGMDVSSGIARFTFGQIALFDGVGLIVLAMGVFGISEMLASAGRIHGLTGIAKVRARDLIPTGEDWRRSTMPTLRGAGVGSVIGALPGTGATIAAYLSYAVERRVSRNRRLLGTGAIEGIAAPESANNAAAQTAFIPTMTMGIPGSASMAIILGALMMHGIYAGPSTMRDHPDLFWGLVASFWVGNLFLLVLNLPLVWVWVSLLSVPYRLIYPVVVLLVCVGVYSTGLSTVDVLLVLVFGWLGYAMKLGGFEPAPFLVGFILGPMFEEFFRRAMQLARGDFTVFLTRPLTAGLLAVSAAILLWVAWATWNARPRHVEPPATPAE